MVNVRRISAFCMTLSGVLAAPHASAQTSPLESVADRERREHGLPGIQFGAFKLLPAAEVGASYNDNIYASTDNERDDTVILTRVMVDIESGFKPHMLGARAYFSRSTNLKYTAEDVSTYGAEARGRYDIGPDTRLEATAGYDRLAESRTQLNSFRTSDKPVTYDSFQARTTLSHDFAQLRTTLSGRYREYNYQDASAGGVSVDQSYRDFHVAEGTAEVVYGLHSLTRFVVRGVIEGRRYDLRPGNPAYDPALLIDRSADGYRIEAGLQRDVTNLIRATVRVGYMRYDYHDARLSDHASFSYHADAVWNVTPLTTLDLAAERRVDETVTPGFAGNLRDEVRLSAKHELFRNLFLTAEGRYARVRLLGSDIRNHEFEAAFGANYHIGSFLALTGEVRHTQRKSDSPGLRFDANMVSIGIKLIS